MAATAAMSRSRFAATFLAVVGSTPGEYLARYRMAVAQDLLRRGRPLALVAEAVGYSGAAAFSRAFAVVCGCAPGAWRQQAQLGPAAPAAQSACSTA
jgi:AraC-like DNA-binding protein